MAIWDTPQQEIWDADAAARYDTPGEGAFAPEVLDPMVDALAALAGGGPALELAIGTGRVAIPLAARGVAVTGIELSEPMIARLHQKAPDLPVVHGDMIDTVVPGRFPLVYLVFNTIANLYTQDAQVAVFENAARHLAPGGAFVIELWVPRPQPSVDGLPAQVFTAREDYLGVDVFDVPNQRVVSRHVRLGPDGAVRVFDSPHRYIYPGELDLMARLAGLHLESRTADWSGAPFTAISGSHVSIYRSAT